MAVMRLCVILIIACLLQACPSSASDIDYFLDDSVPLTQLTSTPPSVPDAASSPASTSAVTPSANPAPLPPLPEYQRHHNIKSSAQDDVLKVDPAVLKACLEWQNRETDIESDALSFSPIWAICIANAAFLFGYATASCCSHKSTHTSSESAHEHEQMTNFRFLSWLWRSVLLILALSFIVECIHSYGHAHSEYLHALDNPPPECRPAPLSSTTLQAPWFLRAYTLAASTANSLKRSIFDPPRNSDCALYLRKTNIVLVVAQNLAETLVKTISKAVLAPVSVLLDILGDSIRVLFDKFSAAEKLFVAALLVALIVCVTVILILLARLLPSAAPAPMILPPPAPAQPVPIQQSLRVIQAADGKLYAIAADNHAPAVELSALNHVPSIQTAAIPQASEVASNLVDSE